MREKLYSLLGDLPDRNRKVSVIKSKTETTENYILEKLLLDLNGIEPVPAYFVYPKNKKKQFPVILYNHAHGGDYRLGKDELIKGRHILQYPTYAEELTKRGYSLLCIDAWTFGERSYRPESEIFKEMLWHGQVLWGMMVYDSLKAIDYLVSRKEVDGNRIGTLGMSMGSTMAWWIAALDERIKACVDICCLTDFESLIELGRLDEHGLYYYVPGLLKEFSTAKINSLIAPRAHLSLVGNFDRLTPPEGLDKIDKELKKVYKTEKVPEAWKLLRFDTRHLETPEMRKETISFLEKWL